MKLKKFFRKILTRTKLLTKYQWISTQIFCCIFNCIERSYKLILGNYFVILLTLSIIALYPFNFCEVMKKADRQFHI